MSYKSILVHVAEGGASTGRYALATAIAMAEGAHLTGLAATGLTELLYNYAAASTMAPLAPEDFDFLTQMAQLELTVFADSTRQLGAAAPECRLTDSSAASALPMDARYCDLLVIAQSHAPEGLIGDSHALARSVVVRAPCPVLVIPAASPPNAITATPPAHVLVAWDGSAEASRAVRAALPLLRRAHTVAAITFNPSRKPVDIGAPCASLAAYLQCHGVDLECLPAAETADAGRALLSLAQARGSDLIVMGSYSHSRLQEIILGGVTRTVLADAGIAVLMAH